MGSALEASSQRIRYHLRRPIPGRGEVLTRNARNTVKEIVPFRISEILEGGIASQLMRGAARHEIVERHSRDIFWKNF